MDEQRSGSARTALLIISGQRSMRLTEADARSRLASEGFDRILFTRIVTSTWAAETVFTMWGASDGRSARLALSRSNHTED